MISLRILTSERKVASLGRDCSKAAIRGFGSNHGRHLCHEAGTGFFVQALEDVDKPALAIFVDSPNLEKVLLKSVPAYGGGQFSYCHEASITGFVKSSSLADFSCAISSIRDFVLNIHGESFAVRLET
ncbi:hypothetical protein LPN04_05630 [Rugamonas sp. A1-17]|nr:hypothetical protein [Rugamonas sp. A1-17]